jgi:hypothetical protein
MLFVLQPALFAQLGPGAGLTASFLDEVCLDRKPALST